MKPQKPKSNNDLLRRNVTYAVYLRSEWESNNNPKPLLTCNSLEEVMSYGEMGNTQPNPASLIVFRDFVHYRIGEGEEYEIGQSMRNEFVGVLKPNGSIVMGERPTQK